MCIKRQTIWHFRRPNVNALKPQKGGKIYKIEIVISVVSNLKLTTFLYT